MIDYLQQTTLIYLPGEILKFVYLELKPSFNQYLTSKNCFKLLSYVIAILLFKIFTKIKSFKFKLTKLRVFIFYHSILRTKISYHFNIRSAFDQCRSATQLNSLKYIESGCKFLHSTFKPSLRVRLNFSKTLEEKARRSTLDNISKSQ